MKLLSANTLLVLALVGTLVVPGAYLGTAADDELFGEDEPDVTMSAADGPNGAYVVADEGDTLKLDLTDPGVNTDARTVVTRVLTFTNTDTRTLDVWLSHDGGDRITLLDADTAQQIERSGSALRLDPGEEVTVDVEIDSHDVEADETLLTTVTIKADVVEETTDQGDEETEDDDGGGGGGGPIEEPEEESEGEPEQEPEEEGEPEEEETEEGEGEEEGVVEEESETDEPGEVDVEFQTEGEETGDETTDDSDEFDVTELTEDDIARIDAESAEEGPKAVISDTAKNEEDDETEEDEDAVFEPGGSDTGISGDATVTQVGQTVELSGELSTVSTTDGVTQRGKITRTVDIDVPEERKDDPARIQLAVSRENLGDTEAENAQIGHRTDDGWRLLETEIVEQSEESVVLEAESQGFSPFAVFVDPEVEYEWELPDGATKSGSTFQHTFTEPGIYDVELTVRDALGRADTTTRTVVADDVPQATIEIDEYDEQAGEVTLTADVENELGNTTLLWTLPNGTETNGTSVTIPIDSGEQTVQLRVEDEYGAASVTTETLSFDEDEGLVELGAAIDDQTATAIVVTTSLFGVIGLAIALRLLGVSGLAALYRNFSWATLVRYLGRGPRVVEVGEPVLNRDGTTLFVRSVEAVAQNADLERLTISLTDEDGTVLTGKEIDVSNTLEYSASPARLPLLADADIDPLATYVVEVSVTDADDRTHTRESREFSLPRDTDHSTGSRGAGLLERVGDDVAGV